jgi:uncharacterized membrane protein
MHFQVSVAIDAPADRVWSVLSDVERWPEWTPTMTSVQRLDPGQFRPGSQARIKQPKLPAMVWTVSSIEPLRQFTWSTTSGGVVTVAGHVITPGPGSGVTVTLSIDSSGLLTGVVDLLYAGLTRDYVTTEAARLKHLCEAGALLTMS